MVCSLNRRRTGLADALWRCTSGPQSGVRQVPCRIRLRCLNGLRGRLHSQPGSTHLGIRCLRSLRERRLSGVSGRRRSDRVREGSTFAASGNGVGVSAGAFCFNDVADEGPLTHAVPAMVLNLITDLHSLLWDALLAAALLHVMAISVYAVAKGQNLLRPMLTGRKQLPDQITPPRVTSLVLAGVVLGGSVAVVALLATFL